MNIRSVSSKIVEGLERLLQYHQDQPKTEFKSESSIIQSWEEAVVRIDEDCTVISISSQVLKMMWTKLRKLISLEKVVKV